MTNTAISSSFIHYLPRRVVLNFPQNGEHPWFRRYQKRGDSFDFPTRHTTQQRTGIASTVKPGDCIWIVSQIFSPWGPIPPSIDARIDVQDIKIRKDGGYNYMAASSSKWFPLLDAQVLLQTLETVNAEGQRKALWRDISRPIGHSLQSMRRLYSANPLIAWENDMAQKPLNFISYRIADGTAGAFQHARLLAERGESVFWDRWCLPRRLAERRELVSSTKLNEKLMNDLRSATIVWGIETEKYWEKNSYAQKEFAEAQKLGIYRPVLQTHEN